MLKANEVPKVLNGLGIALVQLLKVLSLIKKLENVTLAEKLSHTFGNNK